MQTKPPHVRDEVIAQRVKLLAGMLGATSAQIGLIVGLSAPTVLKYYRHEYEVGGIEAAAQVAQSLFRAATNKDKPNVVACIFYLKSRAGWREDGGELPMGKKEAQELLAKVADKGTTWDGLLEGN